MLHLPFYRSFPKVYVFTKFELKITGKNLKICRHKEDSFINLMNLRYCYKVLYQKLFSDDTITKFAL